MFSFLYKLGLLYIFVFVQVNALEDVSQKSSSKLSDFKAKLAKTELSAKYVESDSVNLQESYDNESIADLGISVPPEHANDTLKEDHHTYYNSTFYSDPEAAKSLWVDLDSLPGNHVITHEMLSDSHRQATTVELSFDFPFYGSLLRNVTIATGGFLYTGDYLHNWIAATQYIAPLMANFDTSISTESQIKYADRSSSFVVQWNKVFIQGRMNDGPFTFQVVLKQNGDIVFGYKDVPYPISNISESHHPVKIGISDAYILETSLFFVRRKTIYEYHRIDLLKRNITNNTALYFTALPTCSSFKDCTSCMAADAKLECNWCEAVKRCSDGIDRLRQNWLSNGCMHVKTRSCPASSVSTSTDQSLSSTSPDKGVEITTKYLTTKDATSKSASTYSFDSSSGADNSAEYKTQQAAHFIQDQSLSSTSPDKGVEITTKYLTTKDATSKSASTYSFDSSSGADNSAEYKTQQAAHFIQEEEERFQRSISPGAIATIVIFLTALIAAGIWVAYAYKFPQTPSGQFLIKYRPSQWVVKKEDTGVITNSRHL